MWYLGQAGHERREIISAAYGDKLAVQIFGRRLRNLMQMREHLDVFPELRLSPDSKAADLWHTTAGGVFVGAGVGGGITGFGAHILLIDDPVKGYEDAQSLTIREKCWNWFTYDAYTRVMDNGAIVIIGTRWHEDDVIGRILREMEAGGDQYEVINFPAIDEQGRALWPDRYPVEYLDKRRRLDERMFNCLYQGNPVPDEGNYFKRAHIQRYSELPKDVRFYGASDYAVTSQGGDYTVHLVVAVDVQGRIYVVDMYREQSSSDAWVESCIDLMEKWRPIMWAEEQGQIIKGVGPFLKKRMHERQVFVTRKQFTSAKDKVTRSRAIQGRFNMDMVFIPKNMNWASDMIAELLKFDQGAHDDIVDTLSLIGRMLAAMRGETPASEKPGPKFFEDLTMNELWEQTIKHDDW